MISKELLSEVLNIENSRISKTVESYQQINDTTMAIHYYMKDGAELINIYELQYKIKEWLISKQCCVLSGNGFKKNIGYVCTLDTFIPMDIDEVFEADTEFEAVVKAADYILELRKK
jgi:NADH:ubiquinone oxidoreductase subunit B-like Fe-S oxidoreductase